VSGIGVNTGEIASAATSVKATSQAIGELTKELASPKVTAQDFGRAHGSAAQAYFDGLQKLGKVVDANARAVDDYAGKLNSAARGYESSDSSGAGVLHRAGGAGA
jgi:uncharacterized protein YukE